MTTSSSVSINLAQARVVFLQALALAKGDTSLPEEWVQRTREVGKATNKTFVALLGTALLARATELKVDPLVVNKSRGVPAPGFASYQPRSVGHNVLVPLAFEHGVHLGRLGREPLNNQPIYGSAHVYDLRERTRDLAAADVERLIVTLERVRELNHHELLPALAAFIRERQAFSQLERTARLDVGKIQVSFERMSEVAAAFVTADPEGGRRGQALVAAVLELNFARIDAGSVNDPSRRWPGDVHAFAEGDESPILAVEVRQKPVTLDDLHAFMDALSRKRIKKAMLTALSHSQTILDPKALENLSVRYNVLLNFVVGVEELLRQGASWSTQPLDVFVTELPPRVLLWLERLQVSQSGRSQWVAEFKT